jgi:hypothetical protein
MTCVFPNVCCKYFLIVKLVNNSRVVDIVSIAYEIRKKVSYSDSIHGICIVCCTKPKQCWGDVYFYLYPFKNSKKKPSKPCFFFSSKEHESSHHLNKNHHCKHSNIISHCVLDDGNSIIFSPRTEDEK